MHLSATLSKLGARKKIIVIPLWTTHSILDPPRLAPGDRTRRRVIIAEMKHRFYSRSVAIVQQKTLLKKTPFTRFTGEYDLFLNSCLSTRVYRTPPSTPINRSTPIYNSLQLEKRSLKLFSFFFIFFFEPVDVTRL